MKTMETNLLIDRLAQECAPVRSLRCPATRALTWLGIALPLMIGAAFIYPGARADAMIFDARTIVEQTAALLTSITAVFAAFAVTVPGYDRRVLLLPVLPLLVWIGTLVAGSADEWLRVGFAGLWVRAEWVCLRWICTVGTIPAIILGVMLRKGAPMSPYATAALGGLAAATLAHFASRLFHAEEVSVLMTVWHSAIVMGVSALAGWAGQ